MKSIILTAFGKCRAGFCHHLGWPFSLDSLPQHALPNFSVTSWTDHSPLVPPSQHIYPDFLSPVELATLPYILLHQLTCFCHQLNWPLPLTSSPSAHTPWLYLGLVEGVDELFIVQNVALRLKEQLQDSVLNGLQLVLVRIDPDDQLVPLLLQVWSLKSHNITEDSNNSSHWTLRPKTQITGHSNNTCY